jgi:hypothetical protein
MRRPSALAVSLLLSLAAGLSAAPCGVAVNIIQEPGENRASVHVLLPVPKSGDGKDVRWRLGPSGSLRGGKAVIDLEPGHYRVRATCDGTVQVTEPFHLRAGIRRHFTFCLARVRVFVHQRDDAARPTAILYRKVVSERRGRPSVRWKQGTITTLADRRATFYTLPGTYRVLMKCHGTRAWSPTFATTASEKRVFEFSIARLRLTFHGINAHRGGIMIQQWLDPKHFDTRKGRWRGGSVGTVNDDEQITFHVVPGCYRFKYPGKDGWSYAEIGRVRSSRPVTVDVDVETGLSLTHPTLPKRLEPRSGSKASPALTAFVSLTERISPMDRGFARGLSPFPPLTCAIQSGSASPPSRSPFLKSSLIASSRASKWRTTEALDDRRFLNSSTSCRVALSLGITISNIVTHLARISHQGIGCQAAFLL